MNRIYCVSRMDLLIYYMKIGEQCKNWWMALLFCFDSWEIKNSRFLKSHLKISLGNLEKYIPTNLIYFRIYDLYEYAIWEVYGLFSRRKNSNVRPQQISVIFKNKCKSTYRRFLDFKTPQLKIRPPSRCYTAVCIWLEQTKPNGLRGRSKTTLTKWGR